MRNWLPLDIKSEKQKFMFSKGDMAFHLLMANLSAYYLKVYIKTFFSELPLINKRLSPLFRNLNRNL
jgi:hypothetical protein